jgi:proteasome lid subunit RPN8/RPN11
MRLRVVREVHDAMIAHARAEHPNECCGLLLATGDVLDEAIPARNLAASRVRFHVDPADHFAAIRRARSTGRSVRAAYHSHPRGPSEPSRADAEEANDPSLLCIIVSLAADPPSVAGFEWRDGNFIAIDLVPVP